MARRRRKKTVVWPEWWQWELEISPHVEKRMVDRHFTEIDLRTMLQKAKDYRRDIIEGRWVIETTHSRSRWEVIVEPDYEFKLLVVVTAYQI